MINEKKIKFWDKFFWIAVALFVIPMVLYISSSESLSNNDTFNFILGLGWCITPIKLKDMVGWL